MTTPSLSSASHATAMTKLTQLEGKFMSASKFAVVGASNNPSKWGAKILNYLADSGKDVVPINKHETVVHGIPCLKQLSDLPDPSHTSISIVVPPEETIRVLREAKELGVLAIWLQPGAEDQTVVKFIKDSHLEDRCIYSTQSLRIPHRTKSKSEAPLTELVNISSQVHIDTGGQGCRMASIENPSLFEGNAAFVAEPSSFAPEVSAATDSLDKSSLKRAAEVPAVSAPPLKTRKIVPKNSHPSSAPDSEVAALEAKEHKFMSASKFAVVGVSNDPSKYGYKIFKLLLKQGKDVVPVSLDSEVQGVHCLKSLSELPEPTKTSISVVVPPKAALEVLHQAKDLGIFGIWLQPGAEDSAVVQYIQDANLEDRCIHSTPHAGGAVSKATATGPPGCNVSSVDFPSIISDKDLAEIDLAAASAKTTGASSSPCLLASLMTKAKEVLGNAVPGSARL